MSDAWATEALPAPAPPRRRSTRTRVVLGIVTVLSVVVGVAAGSLLSDRATEERATDEVIDPSGTARPIPLLQAGALGTGLSGAVALYGVEQWASATRDGVLGAWGAAFSRFVGAHVGGPVPAGRGDLAQDARLTDPAGAPEFFDPCAGRAPGDAGGDGCPDAGESTPGEILPDAALPPNAAVVVAFPRPDVALATECTFDDLRSGEVPVAVITANPGNVELVYGVAGGVDHLTVEVDSNDAERAEWDGWIADPTGPRPPRTFVAHCIALPPLPAGGPVLFTATAFDDDGQVAVAETTTLPPAGGGGGIGAITLTPLDGTLLRVDVPVAAAVTPPEVFVAATTDPLGVPWDCATATPRTDASGWRGGAEAQANAGAATRADLAAFPRLQRTTFPVPEGERSLVCVRSPGAVVASFVAVPPDARRLTLSVAQLELDDAVDAGVITVLGRFGSFDWTPCGAVLPAAAAPAGVLDLTLDGSGALCTSGGDAGAIASAGAVLDVLIAVGDAQHVVRVGLDAAPGGPAEQRYRIPIPTADLGEPLCSAGAELAGCVEPGPDTTIGTLVLSVRWDEGPVGPSGEWRVTGST